MKKYASILLAAIAAFVLAGCGEKRLKKRPHQHRMRSNTTS